MKKRLPELYSLQDCACIATAYATTGSNYLGNTYTSSYISGGKCASPQQAPGDSGLSTGELAGVIAGSVIGALLLGGVAFVVIRRRKRLTANHV